MVNRPSAKEMRKFCTGCDNLQLEGTCSLDKHRETPAGALHDTFSSMIRLLMIRQVAPIVAREDRKALPVLEDEAQMHEELWSNQEKYVARGTCGWASVNGKSGKMAEEEFQEEK